MNKLFSSGMGRVCLTENRIKEQLNLFEDWTSAAAMRANQLRAVVFCGQPVLRTPASLAFGVFH